MRILFVSHSSVVRSYQHKLCELAKFPGVEVHLLVPDRWIEGNRLVQASGPLCHEVTFHVEKAYLVGRVGGYFYRPRALTRLVKRLKPDLVHIEEEPWSVACWQAIRGTEAIGAKALVFTWENIWRRYRWVSEKILRYVLEHAAHIIAGNEEGKGLLLKRGFRKGISVFPQYGVDENAFKRKEVSPLKNKLGLSATVVGYIGRLEPSKGVDLLLRAIARIDSRVSCLILGDGPEKKKLVTLADELGIEGRTVFHGGVPNDKVPDYLNCLDLLVLPSRTTAQWKEQFGRILAEGMACEVPVIGSSSGEISETIGDAGLIFDEDDSEDLGRKIKFILENDSARETLAKKGRSRVMEIYTNKWIASTLYSLYKSLELSE